MQPCPSEKEGKYCKQCSEKTFQPNENSYPDRCRLKKVCDAQVFKVYKDYGSKNRDADCKCKPGYHFESTDQRACVPNGICDKGYGQAEYGQPCEKCALKNSYSDRRDIYQKCLPLRNCEKDSRCTIKKSDGTFNNVCGDRVKDVTQCENATSLGIGDNSGSPLTPVAIVGLSVGIIVALILIIAFVCLCLRRRRQNRRDKQDELTEEQFKKLEERIVERCDEDNAYCKKVLTSAFWEIENRIDRQKWALAQELFRNHHQPAMYEVIVDKYKDKESKYAVNGYLQDWRETKGENSQAVEHLFTCLKQCGREDIVYEICNKFREGREDYPEVVIDAETQLENGVVKKRKPKSSVSQSITSFLFPCASSKKHKKSREVEKQEIRETKDKLLNIDNQSKGEGGTCSKEAEAMMSSHEAGAVYRDHPSPSAPVIDDTGNVHIIVPINRAMSFPIQASS